jgi:hypothetical protein
MTALIVQRTALHKRPNHRSFIDYLPHQRHVSPFHVPDAMVPGPWKTKLRPLSPPRRTRHVKALAHYIFLRLQTPLLQILEIHQEESPTPLI